MKLNGKRVTIYRDSKGPYDAYYQHGGIVSFISDKYKVTRAFDYMGEHIGIPSRKLHLRRNILILLIPLIIIAIYLVVMLCMPKTEYCVIYRWHEPYVNEDGDLVLNIINISPSDLYINVEGSTYTLHQGDALDSVPLISSNITIIYTYNGCVHKEELML